MYSSMRVNIFDMDGVSWVLGQTKRFSFKLAQVPQVKLHAETWDLVRFSNVVESPGLMLGLNQVMLPLVLVEVPLTTENNQVLHQWSLHVGDCVA